MNLGTFLVKLRDKKRFFYLGTKTVNLGTFLVKFGDTLNGVQNNVEILRLRGLIQEKS